MKKITASWILCVLGFVGLLAWLGPQPPRGETSDAAMIADFELVTAESRTVRDEDLRGKYLLVYFGFTHCPDICPTTLLLMTNAIRALGKQADRVQPLFVSVDPERDTPEVTAAYAQHFGKNVLGLSGMPEQIKHAADSFKVYYSKVEDKDSALGYMVDHSSFIYLMDPDGRYLAHFASNVPEAELRKELLRYVH